MSQPLIDVQDRPSAYMPDSGCILFVDPDDHYLQCAAHDKNTYLTLRSLGISGAPDWPACLPDGKAEKWSAYAILGTRRPWQFSAKSARILERSYAAEMRKRVGDRMRYDKQWAQTFSVAEAAAWCLAGVRDAHTAEQLQNAGVAPQELADHLAQGTLPPVHLLKLQGGSFGTIRLTGFWDDVQISDSTVEQLTMQHIAARHMRLSRAAIAKSNWTSSFIGNIYIEQTPMDSAVLDGVHWAQASFVGDTSFCNAQLRNAVIYIAGSYPKTDFSGSDLRGAVLDWFYSLVSGEKALHGYRDRLHGAHMDEKTTISGVYGAAAIQRALQGTTL